MFQTKMHNILLWL